MIIALTGGFLGSGKTTAIAQACFLLKKAGKKVGVITNDQGEQQVDQAYFRSLGIEAGEVSNGCFCCHYDDFDEQIERLRSTGKPDIIFAESVGSCADLVATIAKPLSQMQPTYKTVISIFADSKLLIDILEHRASFLEDSVRYLYKKQLEEADLLILNKTDLLSAKQLGTVDKVLKAGYANKMILHQNSLRENDVQQWIDSINNFTQYAKRVSLDINYDLYSSGEAELAWLDKSLVIQSPEGEATFVATKIIGAIFDQIQRDRLTIGHLKFFLEGENWQEKISFTATSTGSDILLPKRPSKRIRLLINARIQVDPVLLLSMVDRVIDAAVSNYPCTIDTDQWSAFKPGYPRPTHRIP